MADKDKNNMLNETFDIKHLYTQYRQELMHYLRKKFVMTDAEAEDFVQVTYSRLSRVGNVGEIENARAYLYKTANNVVIDHIRQKERHERWVKGEVDQVESVDQSVLDPARIHAARQDLKTLKNVISSMPDKRRMFLKMSRYDNLSNVEIARREGISEAAVRKHIAKAMLELKRSLNESHGEEKTND